MHPARIDLLHFEHHQVIALVVQELDVDETQLSMDRDAISVHVNCHNFVAQE